MGEMSFALFYMFRLAVFFRVAFMLPAIDGRMSFAAEVLGLHIVIVVLW